MDVSLGLEKGLKIGIEDDIKKLKDAGYAEESLMQIFLLAKTFELMARVDLLERQSNFKVQM